MHGATGVGGGALERFRPVVALEVHGLLERLVLDGPPPEGVLERDLTMRRNEFVVGMGPEPEWDDEGTWRARHWFSLPGVEWVRQLVASGIEVAWASTWAERANTVFAEPLGLPALPVATSAQGAHAQAYELATRYDGRPILWVTPDWPDDGPDIIERVRHPKDRVLTLMYYLPLLDGPRPGDIARMNRWLELAGSEGGHEELRRLRRQHQDRARQRDRRR